MAIVRAEIHIDRNPDRVWEVVGDVGGISRWLPGIEVSSYENGERTCEIGGGRGRLVEKILLRDDAARRYEYTITEGGAGYSSHHASMSVTPEGDGSRFVWEMRLEPEEAAEPMHAVAAGGAQALKAFVEADR